MYIKGHDVVISLSVIGEDLFIYILHKITSLPKVIKRFSEIYK